MEGTIQLHNVRSNHWVTTVCSGGVIRLFDSLYMGTIDDDFAEQLRVTYRKLFPKKNLIMQVIREQQEGMWGSINCFVNVVPSSFYWST